VAVQLTSVEVSGLRFAQTVLVQPVQNLITAVQGLLVPRNSRKAHAAARSPGPEGEAAATALRRQTEQLALAATALGGLLVLVVWPLAEFVLSRIQKFADVAPLALPISLQAAAYLVQLPFAAALRGMHQARMLFVQYVVYAGTALSLVVVGAAAGHLEGAAWGLTIAAFVGLVTMMGLYAYAQRFLGQPEVEHVAEDEVTETI
jgi:O-antigen/teichoic acid export membrane protein